MYVTVGSDEQAYRTIVVRFQGMYEPEEVDKFLMSTYTWDGHQTGPILSTCVSPRAAHVGEERPRERIGKTRVQHMQTGICKIK